MMIEQYIHSFEGGGVEKKREKKIKIYIFIIRLFFFWKIYDCIVWYISKEINIK